ncbi:MAG: hypothetical protein IKD89_08530 [Clostridia bacterium]|nr:hypothetical protein [Clostridia bacterium]
METKEPKSGVPEKYARGFFGVVLRRKSAEARGASSKCKLTSALIADFPPSPFDFMASISFITIR